MKRFPKIFLTFFLLFSFVLAQKPYVILISFDGFRWDYPNRGITPAFSEIAGEGVHALSLQPAFPSKTFPNHYSIITGMYPEHHGIIANIFPDPVTGEIYKLSDHNAVQDSRWYIGEAFWQTAKRNGIITASYFWPGSEVNLEYRRPDYYKEYDKGTPYKSRIDSLIEWLKMPANKRPRFNTIYFRETDDIGHGYGPNSPEINIAIAQMDSLLIYLRNGLRSTLVKDSVNLIVVSDHGMTDVSLKKSVNIEKKINNPEVLIVGNGPVMMITPPQDDINKVYSLLKKNENHFKVYKKEDVPDFYHYNESMLISPVVLIADLGWSLIDNKIENGSWGDLKGNHGYDNHQIDMHGIFYACGPLFKQNYVSGTIWNIDIYPLLCKIYGIGAAPGIDGKLERIGFILK